MNPSTPPKVASRGRNEMKRKAVAATLKGQRVNDTDRGGWHYWARQQ